MVSNQSSYKWVILILTWTLGFFMFGTVFAFPPLLEIVKTELSLSYTDTGFLLAIPLIAIVFLAIPSGFLVDKIGFKITAGIGGILVGLGCILRGLSIDFAMFLFSTALLGAGVGICYPNLPKIISAWFPKKYVGTATGIYVTGLTIGPTVAMSLALLFFVPLTGSWRGTFFLWGGGAWVATAVWWILSRGFNIRTTEETRLLRGIITERHTWMISIILLFGLMIFYMSTQWLPSFYGKMGVERETANLMTSSISLASTPAIFFIPFVSDWIGLRRPFLWFPLAIAAAVSLSLLFTPTAYGWVILPILGITMSAPFVLAFILPVEIFHHEQVGSASGIILAIGYFGGFLGSWIVGYLKDITGSFEPLVYLMVLSCIAIIALTFAIPETGKRTRDKASK